MLKIALICAVMAVCCVEAEVVMYLLSTRENLYQPERLPGFGALPSNSVFNRDAKTVMLIHGHNENRNSRFNLLTKDAILSSGEPTNVIVVDWGWSNDYSANLARVPFVARDLEDFIRWLNQRASVDVTKLHLVGFGLGAYVAGMAGRWLNRSNGYVGRVGRITALDPTGSGWDERSPRLRVNDATFVEVIYTDSTGLLANGLGLEIGNLNFYANGGGSQPGCLTHSCSHDRAYELFAASMVNPDLVGYPCSTKIQMTLNNCKGSPVHVGGTELTKYFYNVYGSRIFRVNTGRNYPY